MELKTLGNTNIKTPPIMFGGNVFGWTLDEKESFRMLDMLLDRGFTFIDTADSYGKETGLSEKIIGKWMKDRKVRHEITLATKAGNVHTKKPDGTIERSRDNSPAYLKKCIENSLQRLQTDHIDLFYTHFDDEDTPVKDVLETYQEFIKAGKTRIIGASNFSQARLKEALELAENSDLPKYEVFQTEYNLMEREEFEGGLGELCSRYDVSTATYFSLASGFLTGKYRTKEDFKGTSRQMLT
ncbi:MAG TPA: aldo/keto reductase, partial [Flavobacteriaceae bacterium]|nr:aldo/keto reductase [Flavobacteriaceae bacterium]